MTTPEDFWRLDMRLFTFTASGATPAAAADAATRQANDWLVTHRWRTADGLPSYTVTSVCTAVQNETGLVYVYVVHFYGPASETREIA